ncbi:MAG: isoprenylcysteine carboxylmethyltransferase family protein [Gemmatimonadetes bacterium]|nr:isoprenylcysteine carboxylmethyltransferase family protein [Gemmatimonadota bacterium]MDA1104511.1 isoprenylcysteine carboxylmethyltransferase family protein [Gemmatimonadota bacterium]
MGGSNHPEATPTPEADDWGSRLFRWRSYPPVFVVALIVLITLGSPRAISDETSAVIWSGVGIALGIIGLAIRAAAIAAAQPGTSGRSTRAMTADALNSDGMYSVVRHPLYLGNLFLWLGVAAISGHPLAIASTVALFGVLYRPIIRAEDRFLRRRFGSEFERWAKRTPSFLPSRRSVFPSRFPFNARRWLDRDYHAVYAFVVASSVVGLAGIAAQSALRTPASRVWLSYLIAGTVIFTALHVLRRTGHTGRGSEKG